jgi:hypothetical protein
VARAIAPLMLADEPTRQRFLSHFAILTDDHSSSNSCNTPPKWSRASASNHETKTVSR